MALMVFGVNYQTAAIDIRERVTFDIQAAILAARYLVSEGFVREAVIISTCNRTELYCEGSIHLEPFKILIGQLGVSFEIIQPYTYQHLDLSLVKHLMRVATGLDSMIMGEVEILGQLKKAYTAAANAGTVGKYLGRLFQTTFAMAKTVRTQTGIGVNPVSVAYTAARLSQHIFSDLATVSVLLVGAGDLIQLIAQHLSSMGVQKMYVTNRTEANASALVSRYQAEYVALEKMPDYLAKADIVITGTASRLPMIGKGMVERALRQRKHKPIFMVDLGVPRNIECEVNELEDVYLYCIDDLQNKVEENKRFRRDAAESAEQMIKIAADRFMSWLIAQDAFKILSVFREKFEHIRDDALQNALRRLEQGAAPEVVVKRLATDLTNRFLHEPTRRLRKAGFSREEELLTLTRDLFEL
jgi:glutamyl-tRNA reductase